MQRIILLIVCSFLLPFHAFAGEIINADFNNGSWGGLSHGSYWTIQNGAARLEYSTAGTSNKAMSVNVSSAKSNEFWVEMDVKMQNNPSGGSKFLKLFGNGSGSSNNNMTLGLSYSSNKQKEIAYYMDTICTAGLDGDNGGSCTPTYKTTSSAIDMRGGSWGHYKAWIKRADPGSQNGELKIWWNGQLRIHVTNMNSNPSGSSPYIDRIEFGGYNDRRYFSSTWYLWMDNVYVGTTEKGGSPDPPVASTPTTPVGFKIN